MLNQKYEVKLKTNKMVDFIKLDPVEINHSKNDLQPVELHLIASLKNKVIDLIQAIPLLEMLKQVQASYSSIISTPNSSRQTFRKTNILKVLAQVHFSIDSPCNLSGTFQCDEKAQGDISRSDIKQVELMHGSVTVSVSSVHQVDPTKFHIFKPLLFK